MSFDFIHKVFENLPPPPKFDRVAMHDDRCLANVPRRKQPPMDLLGLSPALAGIPVHFDEEVEVGVMELRLGDEVIDRIYLPELRA